MDFIFKVDPIRRNIKVPDAFTVLTMDHNIHKLVFICPYYEDFAFDSASIVFMVDAPDGKQYIIPAEEYESFPNSPAPYVKFTLTLKSYITSVVGYMSFCITADIISSGNVIEKSWHSKNITISIGGHIDNDDSEDIPEEDVPTINQRLNNLDSKVGRLQTTVNGMANGSPTPVATVAEMTDESAVYLYTGSETGYTAGNWYYYDGTAWTSGGQYGGATTSTTFNQHGVPADDFAVGEALVGKADSSDVTALTTVVAGKADTSNVTAIDTRVTAVEGEVDVLDGKVSDIEESLYKTYEFSDSVTKAVAVGDYRQSTAVLEFNVPANQEFTIRLSTDATHGNITLYALFSDGTDTVLSNNLAADTDLTYTREKEIVRFYLYTANGFTGAGTLEFSVRYEIQNENSIEEQIEVVDARVDNLAETIADKIPESTAEFLDLEHIPASANRIDPDKFIHGKQINWAYGTVTDAPTVALYYLPVQPEDTVYFWRLHNGGVMSAYSDGIAVFDESGDIITRGGIGGYQYSYTVPANVYKLGLNIKESHLAEGDKYIAIFNDSENPEEYEPYREANDAYFSTNEFLKDVDFNSILPNACKLPEAGFIRSVGHGGLSKYYPFDTEWGIIGAKKAGLTQVESDIQITADGVYVLYHDADLRRVGGTQQQTIASMTYEQLNENFDFGAWFSPKFAGTELCTLDKAVRLCRELGLDIWLDCKTVTTTAEIAGAGAILDKWGMLDHAYWVNGNFANVWSVYPNARVVFPAGSKLTGSTWDDADEGWFASFNGNFPSDKKQFVDGMPVVPEGVWFGISQNYQLMDDASYGIEGLYHESELARERNIKYGFYAVDDVEIIAQLSEAVPYQQYLTSNAIAYQNAMNAHYGINLADYNLDV